MTKEEVSVVDLVDINGDVDHATGDIDAPIDVRIKGTVRQGFKVRSTGTVTVEGTIEGSVVEAKADVLVQGGILGHSNGRVQAGRNVTTRFCDEANLKAGQDVVITHEVMNSRIHASGRVDISHGALIGGYVYARQEARIKELGNEAEVQTFVAVGLDPALVAEVEVVKKEISKKERVVGQIRSQLKPLMDQVRRLTPQQREHVTELMFQADQMEMDRNKQQEQINAVIAAKSSTTGATLHVITKIFPGANVVLGDLMTTFRQERRGPLRITRRAGEDSDQIVLIDDSTDQTILLPSVPSTNSKFWVCETPAVDARTPSAPDSGTQAAPVPAPR